MCSVVGLKFYSYNNSLIATDNHSETLTTFYTFLDMSFQENVKNVFFLILKKKTVKHVFSNIGRQQVASVLRGMTRCMKEFSEKVGIMTVTWYETRQDPVAFTAWILGCLQCSSVP